MAAARKGKAKALERLRVIVELGEPIRPLKGVVKAGPDEIVRLIRAGFVVFDGETDGWRLTWEGRILLGDMQLQAILGRRKRLLERGNE